MDGTEQSGCNSMEESGDQFPVTRRFDSAHPHHPTAECDHPAEKKALHPTKPQGHCFACGATWDTNGVS